MIILKLSDRTEGSLEKTPHTGELDGQTLFHTLLQMSRVMALLEADIQCDIGAILEVFPSKVNWSKVELCMQEEEHLKAFTEYFI